MMSMFSARLLLPVTRYTIKANRKLTGMNWAEKRSAMVWTFALRCVASSTMWTIRATAVWSPTFTARITSRPLLTTVPANTWSPSALRKGMYSPVIDA